MDVNTAIAAWLIHAAISLRSPENGTGAACGYRAEPACRWPQRTDLITASTSGFLAVTVVSATVQLPILPEINHVDQEFLAGTADEASRVPQFIVASPFSIDGRVTCLHTQFAAVAGLKGKPCKQSGHHNWRFSSSALGEIWKVYRQKPFLLKLVVCPCRQLRCWYFL